MTTTTLFVACKKNDETAKLPTETAEFKNRSITPSFIKMASDFAGVGEIDDCGRVAPKRLVAS